MDKATAIEEYLEQLKKLEKDIETLQSNISKAKEYLKNIEAENLDAEYFDENFNIEKGLKYIEVF